MTLLRRRVAKFDTCRLVRVAVGQTAQPNKAAPRMRTGIPTHRRFGSWAGSRIRPSPEKPRTRATRLAVRRRLTSQTVSFTSLPPCSTRSTRGGRIRTLFSNYRRRYPLGCPSAGSKSHRSWARLEDRGYAKSRGDTVSRWEGRKQKRLSC